ncbi:MAG: transglutaminase domain-containing protein [Deltaproteobacteria bacterium]
MDALKKNKQLYNHLKQILKEQHKLRFGGLFGLSPKALSTIESLELDNIPSGKGLESLPNLKGLKLIINDPNIDIASYINSIEGLSHLNKLDLNIPNIRYLSQEQIKSVGDLEDVNSSFNISTISWNGFESYSAEEMLQINQTMDDFKKLVNPLMSEEEKAERIYHELGNYISFDDDQKNRIRDGDLAGALIDRQAICQGYSKALEAILNDNGIECITVGGQGGKPGDMGHHAWNQAKVNGSWYNMDLTFDSASDKEGFNKGNWKHFLKSDTEFNKSHILEDKGHPCEDTRYDNREIKISHKPFLRGRAQERTSQAQEKNQPDAELTPLQQHFAEVEAKAAQNPQQNFKPGFSLTNIPQGLEK